MSGDARDRGATPEFERLRPRLFGIAYRMLGTRAEAEDIVQEAWLRLQGAAGVDSVEGFLVTAVTRLCIDHLRSARVRRETYVGPWLPEPIVTSRPDPAVEVERAEALSLALLRVLDQLDPLERAVFLLREVFDYPYEEVARVVGRRVDHCRQLAHRARARVREERPPTHQADPAEHELLLRRFLEAASVGDLEAFESLLAEDVVLVSDGGGKTRAALNPIYGPDRVQRFMIGVQRKLRGEVATELAWANGLPAALVRIDGRLDTLIALDVRNGRISSVFVVRNPEKLPGSGAAGGRDGRGELGRERPQGTESARSRDTEADRAGGAK